MKKVISLFLVLGIVVGATMTSKSVEAQPVVVSNRCCDNNGTIRCITSNYTPVGNPCFCYGQGWGTTC